jgi:acetylornithine deacetylase/succinyl-diaminopimelate desuccinylase-like protein
MKQKYLDDFFTFLRFPSISTDPKHKGDMIRCAKWLAQRLNKIGLQAKIMPTGKKGHPAVVAKNQHRKDRKTVLIYGHYDVQPVDPIELWKHPPFEPHLANGIVTARGATDNKGQILAHILGVEKTIEEKGDLPVNVIFLIEGEEEIGSVHLGNFIRKYRKELACDVIVISDTTMIAPNTPTLTCGLRGILTMDAHLSGPAMDLHSGSYGGAVVNPVTAMARLIATLHDKNWKIQIPGIYDDVRPIQKWEKKEWRRLKAADRQILNITKAPALDGEVGYTSQERIMARPTAEVNGIYGGYQGEGSKTILPKEAHVKLSFRLVPNQTPDRVKKLVEKHLRRHCPKTVKLVIEWGHGGEPYIMDPTQGFGLAAQRALRKAFGGAKPVLLRDGGSIPIVADFKKVLKADTLLLGLALPDCGAHSPNETFPLKSLETGIRLNEVLLEELA